MKRQRSIINGVILHLSPNASKIFSGNSLYENQLLEISFFAASLGLFLFLFVSFFHLTVMIWKLGTSQHQTSSYENLSLSFSVPVSLTNEIHIFFFTVTQSFFNLLWSELSEAPLSEIPLPLSSAPCLFSHCRHLFSAPFTMCVMLLKLLPVLKHHLYFLVDLGYYKLLEFLFCLAGPIIQDTHVQSGCESY